MPWPLQSALAVKIELYIANYLIAYPGRKEKYIAVYLHLGTYYVYV